MSGDPQPPYRVVSRPDGFAVEDGEGHSLMEARDPRSAEHYASLLNRAWRAGFKAGWRAGAKPA